jgi:hypothetical protein
MGSTSDSKPKPPRYVEMAYQSYCLAEQKLGANVAKQRAYDWLKEEGLAEYELPDFENWARYVRLGQRHYRTQKNSPRAGRTGPSIVRAEDIEPPKNRMKPDS